MPSPRTSLPKDGSNTQAPLAPAVPALSRSVISSLSSSTTLAITSGATFIRFYATSQDVYLKWGATAVDATNFDEVIPAGQVVDVFIPVESTGNTYTTCRLIERAASAALVQIQK